MFRLFLFAMALLYAGIEYKKNKILDSFLTDLGPIGDLEQVSKTLPALNAASILN